MDPILELVSSIVRGLVDTPGDVHVHRAIEDEKTVYYVKTRSGEAGQIIGKSGILANNMRGIVRAAAKKLGQKDVYVFITSA